MVGHGDGDRNEHFCRDELAVCCEQTSSASAVRIPHTQESVAGERAEPKLEMVMCKLSAKLVTDIQM